MAAALTKKHSTMLAMSVLMPLILSSPAFALPQGPPRGAISLDATKLTNAVIINFTVPTTTALAQVEADKEGSPSPSANKATALAAMAPGTTVSVEEGSSSSSDELSSTTPLPAAPVSTMAGSPAAGEPVGGQAGAVPASEVSPPSTMATAPPAQNQGMPSVAMGVGMIQPPPPPETESSKEPAASQPPTEGPAGQNDPRILPAETLTVTKTVTKEGPAGAGASVPTPKPIGAAPARGATGAGGDQQQGGSNGQQSAGASGVEPCAVLSKMQADFFKANRPQVMTAPIAAATDCLNSVPINKEAALAQIEGVKKYVGFQSTLAFLKNPPKDDANQQPQGPVDILSDMDQLAKNIQSGKVVGEYDFETQMHDIIARGNDGHFQLSMPMLAMVGYSAPFDMMPFSVDGKSMPKIFRVAVQDNQLAVEDQAVTKMNGQDIVEALKNMSSSIPFQSPDARFNALFPGKGFANQITMDSAFRNMGTYPGSDEFSLTFENGTTTKFPFQALIATDLTGVQSGKDFFDKLVMPPPPTPEEQQRQQQQQQQQQRQQGPAVCRQRPGAGGQGLATTGGLHRRSLRKTFDSVRAAQKTMTMQWKPMQSKEWTPKGGVVPVAVDGGGLFSGFFLNNSESTAVMRLSTFNPPCDQALTNTIDTMAAFLQKCRETNKTNLIIDMQNNPGGAVVLGVDVYAQLFPDNQQPLFSAQRQRASEAGLTYAKAFANINEQSLEKDPQNGALAFAASCPWALAGARQVNNSKPFPSLEAWVGPQTVNSDKFTNNWRFLDGGDGNIGLGLSTQLDPSLAKNLKPAFKPENMILLTDGRCSSTCSTFSEFMQLNKGVRTVTVGGIPQNKGMANVGGVRGSEVLEYETLGLFTQALDAISPPQSQQEKELRDSLLPGELPIQPVQASINFLDNIREGSTTPLQFVEDAADCRMFYTPDSFQDLSILWTSVANSAFDGAGNACAMGSLQAGGKQQAEQGLGGKQQQQQAQQEEQPARQQQIQKDQQAVQGPEGCESSVKAEPSQAASQKEADCSREQSTGSQDKVANKKPTPIGLCGGVPC